MIAEALTAIWAIVAEHELVLQPVRPVIGR